ncbi:MAG TPA: DUF6596 domain-containing protein [Intrasporangium sp.]|uniref:RNA polymerase sigma factor n=1 Tax=Intrasporangium sp. TaxID=1925024 RepID=UPI002B4715FD|nr:DUF6596 domain-containing protein [Intrasporangium sp.]HKX67281.1 DUF6596 domain-containing protein [Intrasporangium sp.]
MQIDTRTEDLLRREAPQVLGALVRRYGHFDLAEDAVQEALLRAADQWQHEGLPDRPRAWLIRVASRVLTDLLRREMARQSREERLARAVPVDGHTTPAPGVERPSEGDDSLVLFFLCCHPAISPPSQVALMLRAVGGLTTEEIARAYLVPSATMGQRISRAKSAIAAAGARFLLPTPSERDERLPAVLHALYLVFNEGYTATSGEQLVRVDLSSEAIRLTRMLRTALPSEPGVAGLLALMLLTEARRPARIDDRGDAVPLPAQDRSLWNRELIDEGTALVTEAMSLGPLGPYQLQAAIAALHDEATTDEATDWPQILALYTLLQRYDDSPVVALSRLVAVAEVQGAATALRELATIADEPRLRGNLRVQAVHAHLLERAGDADGARRAYERAAALTASEPERRYLTRQGARLGGRE